MLTLIILLPFIGWLLGTFFGRNISVKGSIILIPSLIFISSILSWIAFYYVGILNSPVNYKLLSWINADKFAVDFGLLFDTPTVSMLILVTTVSFCVHWFACDYMANDPHLPRFLSYLSLFTFFMVILVTADNYLQLFIGWEGVGVCSYLLINFWFTRIQANKAAIKAMIMNRVGDLGFVLAMFFIYDMFNSLEFYSIFNSLASGIAKDYNFFGFYIDGYEIITVLLLIGAIGKSAQIGLHTWLPDAMEGPTPVSALIHAATMVTAGVFLLIRSSPIIDFAPNGLMLITIVGATTCFLASTIGIFQYDIKKVIAYSTCSQLGYMIFICGLSAYSVSLFHLINHGFFKALLFLSAGNVIHAMANEQDMRKLGGLIKKLPFTYALMFVGSLSLMGFPYLTGYYSKDTILELSQAPLTSIGFLAYLLGVYAAFGTAFYSIRLLYYTFLSNTNAPLKSYANAHDVNIYITPPLIFLALASIFIGYLLRDAFIGLGSDFFNGALPSYINYYQMIEADFLSLQNKFLPVFFSLIASVLALILNSKFNFILTSIQLYDSMIKFFTFFSSKWYFDLIYNSKITKPLLNFAHEVSFKTLDKGLFEIIGPSGLVKIFNKLSNILSTHHSGIIYHYALIFIITLFCTVLLIQTNFSSNIFIWIVLVWSLFTN